MKQGNGAKKRSSKKRFFGSNRVFVFLCFCKEFVKSLERKKTKEMK